jgi:hypothetical protein
VNEDTNEVYVAAIGVVKVLAAAVLAVGHGYQGLRYTSKTCPRRWRYVFQKSSEPLSCFERATSLLLWRKLSHAL